MEMVEDLRGSGAARRVGGRASGGVCCEALEANHELTTRHTC